MVCNNILRDILECDPPRTYVRSENRSSIQNLALMCLAIRQIAYICLSYSAPISNSKSIQEELIYTSPLSSFSLPPSYSPSSLYLQPDGLLTEMDAQKLTSSLSIPRSQMPSFASGMGSGKILATGLGCNGLEQCLFKG